MSLPQRLIPRRACSRCASRSAVDLPRYHPQVRTWEVKTDKGEHVGIFFGDYYARATKRSGAWMSNFRGQSNVSGRERPIVVNVMNFAQGEEGQPTLLVAR